MWTSNTLIRNKENGKILLVIHVYRNCTLVVDLQDQSELVQPKALLEKEYHYWVRDTDMENTDEVEYKGTWYAKPVFM